NAALMTRKVIDNSFDVLAVQALALAQAIDFLKYHTRMSSFTHKFFDEVRALVPAIVEDKPRYNDIQVIRKYLIKLGSTTPLT
ncbi:MAG TPA: aromatic amino acid lyase, partial [Chryseolinea sp.]|nr:aromatic amino acid lyase [Chryseolinea sp.]